MHKDFHGNELRVGDKVVVAPKYYRGLTNARIIGLTPKKVRLEYRDHCNVLQEYLIEGAYTLKYEDGNVL